MLEYDVAIIGAGPAGASAALECVAAGLSTVIIEKRRLPRHKACSGILIPESMNILRTRGLSLPDRVVAEPPDIDIMIMHFYGGRTVDIPLNGVMIRRDCFDHWLCERSKADIRDGTVCRYFRESADEVVISCNDSSEKPVKIRSRVMIAADGGHSKTVRILDRTTYERLSWYVALQDMYECTNSMDPGCFHFFAMPHISQYSSAYVRDGLLVMEVVVRKGDHAIAGMDRFKEYLWPRVGVYNARLVRRLGCPIAYAAPSGLFQFGTERVLVAGEASGLLNLFGEGISSALASGGMAGNAAVRGIRENVPPGKTYREEILTEKMRTQSQFELRRLIFNPVGVFNWKAGIQRLSVHDRLPILKELLMWVVKLKLRR